MTSWVCLYHIIWATHHRQLSITDSYEDFIRDKVKTKSQFLKCRVYGINMMPDHVHVAVSINPSIAVADWTRQIKGATAYDINMVFKPDETFRWQRGYGVRSFGVKELPFVLKYIKNQKIHHAKDETYSYLETIDDANESFDD